MEAQMAARMRPRWVGGPLKLGQLSDEHLARLAREGDEQAFATLYERYHQQLYSYCRSMLSEEADAKDALQSTFASAFASLERCRPDAPLRPWLFRIAHNEAISLIRRRRLEAHLPRLPELVAPSVDAQAAERERLSLLLADLRELPGRQRAALVMRELSGLSHEEIAIALGLSVGAAKQTIFEARRSLSDRADGRAMSCLEIRHAISDADRRRHRGRKVRAHLRSCAGCSAFAAAIPARKADLSALVPPIPSAGAAGLLARTIGRGGAGHGGGIGGTTAAIAGKGATVIVPKTIASLLVAAAATVGVTTAVRRVLASPSHAGAAGLPTGMANDAYGKGSPSTSTSTSSPATGAPRQAQLRLLTRGAYLRSSLGAGHGSATTSGKGRSVMNGASPAHAHSFGTEASGSGTTGSAGEQTPGGSADESGGLDALKGSGSGGGANASAGASRGNGIGAGGRRQLIGGRPGQIGNGNGNAPPRFSGGGSGGVASGATSSGANGSAHGNSVESRGESRGRP